VFKNKKGQISIEFLLVLSILVVGGVLFGVYYLQSIGKNRQEDVSTDVLDNLITDFASDVNIQELPTNPTGFFSISLNLDPNGPTEENNDFNIIVRAFNDTEHTSSRITSVYIYDNGFNSTTECSLNSLPNQSVYNNLDYYFVTDLYDLTFNCDNSGTYNVLVFADIADDPSYNDSELISKIIVPPIVPPPLYQTFSIDLELDPDSSSQVGADFGVVVSVDENTIYNDPVIDQISILKEGVATRDCSLIGVFFLGGQSTYNVNLPFDSDTNKHTLFFRCSHEETTSQTYSISVDAEIDSNNDFTDNALIQKNIDPLDTSGCVSFTGDIIFDRQSECHER